MLIIILVEAEGGRGGGMLAERGYGFGGPINHGASGGSFGSGGFNELSSVVALEVLAVKFGSGGSGGSVNTAIGLTDGDALL